MGFFDAMDVKLQPLAYNLEHRARRHAAIAANIANVDTPGYKAVDVTFRRALEKAGMNLTRTNGAHLSSRAQRAKFDIVQIGGSARRDGNDVNIEHEMVKLAENQLQYRFLTDRLKGSFNKLKSAIVGRSVQ